MEIQPWNGQMDPEVPRSIDYPKISMYEMLAQAAERNPNGIATLFFGAKIRYSELLRMVDRFADSLAELGVRKGDRVAIILPNIPAYPIAHFAALKLGAVLVPTNPLYVERELAHQLSNAGAETAIVYDKLLPKLEAIRSQTSVKRVIVAGLREFLPPVLGLLFGLKDKSTLRLDGSKGQVSFRAMLEGNAPSAPSVTVSPEDTAILLYTGGTTGVSKGAVLTHRNILVNVYQTRHWLWKTGDKQEVLLCVLPFFHSYGMTTGLHLSVVLASTMLLLPRFDLNDVVKRIRKHKPTVFCGVPSMYNAVNNHPKATPENVGSIRFCLSGGSGLPMEVQKAFEALTGASLVEGFGLSEASPVTHVNPIVGKRKIGTIGLPVSDTDSMIVDPETRKPLAAGQEGELAVKGPQVMKGYWNMPDETAAVLQDGWLYTGDIAVMDEEGFFRIVDRKKDLIISAGMNVYPREVEEVLYQHPKVSEAAVVGIPSAVRDEVVKAFIVAKPGQTLTRGELLQFCRDKLAKFKVPKEIELRDSLPKSAAGKILKRVLRDEELNKRPSKEKKPEE
ncbi:long-chain fatty acid--CoA ligase [bacterium]|nr:long-chain fatty acid--CoA ligase [bacterium]